MKGHHVLSLRNAPYLSDKWNASIHDYMHISLMHISMMGGNLSVTEEEKNCYRGILGEGLISWLCHWYLAWLCLRTCPSSWSILCANWFHLRCWYYQLIVIDIPLAWVCLKTCPSSWFEFFWNGFFLPVGRVDVQEQGRRVAFASPRWANQCMTTVIQTNVVQTNVM